MAWVRLENRGGARFKSVGGSMVLLACVFSQGEAIAADSPETVNTESSSPATKTTADGSKAKSPATTENKSASDDGIQEVVVTARRKSEKAQDVPIPLTALSGAALDDAGIHSVQELQQKLPSTNVFVNSPRMSSYSVRGIGASTIANEGLESSVGMYVDGVYLGKTGMLVSDLNDLDQVEMLRGPQGTLFGKNTTSGAFNVTTRKPSFTPETEGAFTVGNYNDAEFRGSTSGALVGDTLAGRLTLYKAHHDGYLTDTATGKDPNDRNREGFRGQLLGIPTDDSTLRLIAEYHRDVYPQGFVPTLYSVPPNSTLYSKLASLKALGYNALPISTDPYSFNSTGTHHEQDSNQYALTAQYDKQFANGFDLASITGYRGWEFTPHNDSDFMNLDIATCCGMGDKEKQFSQELRLATPKGRTVESTFGLYYFQQHQDAYTRTTYGNDSQLLQTWYGWNAATAGRYLGKTAETDSTLDTTNYAAYTQSDWHVDDRTTLTGGLRESFEEKSIDLTRDLAGTSTTLTDKSSVSNDISNWSLNGTLALKYQAAENLNLYSSYAKGTKSATLSNSPSQTANLRAADLVVKPEKANDFEVGFKSQSTDHRLTVNGNLFYTLIQDYQTNVSAKDANGNNYLMLSNAEWVRTRGAEAEVSALVLPGLTLGATGAFNNAKYLTFTNAGCSTENGSTTNKCDFSGKPLMGASRWTGNLSATYTEKLADDVEGYITASYTYRSGYYGSVDLSAYGWIDGYGITNLRVGTKLHNGDVDLSLWANNLLNTHYYSAMGTTVAGAWYGYVGDPLTVGATAKVHF